MSALLRTLMVLVAIFALSACNMQMISPAAAVAVPTPTFIPVPTRASGIATATPSVCTLTGDLKLGAVVSLSGPASSYGDSIQRGIDLAVQEINASNFIAPDAEMVIVYQDDQTNPEVAISVFTHLIEEEQVLGILGPTLSSAAFAADPLAQQAGVPVIGTSNTADGITEMGSYIFRNSLPEAAVIPNTLGAVSSAYDVETVVLVHDDKDAFTRSGYNTMVRAATQAGLRVLADESFQTGAREFDEAIEVIEEREPDLIMVSALIDEASSFLGQLRAAGIETPVMGGNGFNSANMVVYAAQAAEGAISGAAWSLENSYPENIAFVEHFRGEYNQDPDQFAAQAYTGVYLYAHALKNGCSARQSDVRNALAGLRLVPTPLGSFSFTVDRNPLHAPVVLIFDNGKQMLFEE